MNAIDSSAWFEYFASGFILQFSGHRMPTSREFRASNTGNGSKVGEMAQIAGGRMRISDWKQQIPAFMIRQWFNS